MNLTKHDANFRYFLKLMIGRANGRTDCVSQWRALKSEIFFKMIKLMEKLSEFCLEQGPVSQFSPTIQKHDSYLGQWRL